MPLLFEELFRLYPVFMENKAPHLTAVRPYRDYIQWLAHQDPEAATRYWKDRLSGFTAPTPLPLMQIREGDTYGQEEKFKLESGLYERLKQFSRNRRLTLNTILQGAWAALLSRFSGETDVVFGVTISGRQIPVSGIDRMVGLFINGLPLRVKTDDRNIADALDDIQLQQQQNNQYAYSSLADIQNWSDIPNGVPLFDSIIVFENYPIDDKLKDENFPGTLQFSDFREVAYRHAPITLMVIPEVDFYFNVTYNGNLFQRESIRIILDHLVRLLQGMVDNPEQSWWDIPLNTGEDLRRLTDWNKTENDFPTEQRIVDLVREQAYKTPDNIAVVFEDHRISYRRLNTLANRLAHHLIAQGVEAETLVGICFQRSIEMIVAILAVWKAGGAYLALEPDYPESRLRFMIHDSALSTILTVNHLTGSLPEPGKDAVNIICLDDKQQREAMAECSEDDPVRQSGPENLAFAVYTSGSTGQPKGILTPHRGAVNYLHYIGEVYQLSTHDRILQLTAYSFDASVRDMIGPLTQGARVVMVNPQKYRETAFLLELMRTHRVTGLLSIVPSYLSAMVETENDRKGKPGDYDALRVVLVSGEALKESLCHQTRRVFGEQVVVVNQYGPTETTMTTTYHPVSLSDRSHYRQETGDRIALIGRPVPNTRIYILDQNLNTVPVGVPGQLYIGGVGLTRGYVNNPEMTNEKFVAVHLESFAGLLYSSGDRARYLADGNLQYLGRIDHQVKLRGFRVELAEIDNLLARHESVKEAVTVLYQPDDNPVLASYIVPAPDARSEADGLPRILRSWLTERLPEYMLPAAITVLEKLPLTPNGKIDRKSLPAP